METKFEKLEKVLSELNISDKELVNWINSRNAGVACLIPTELSLVYRHGKEFTIKNGLDLSLIDELWGIQLLSGTIVALMLGVGKDVSLSSWKRVKLFAEQMTLCGRPGSLPSRINLKKSWGNAEKEKFEATIKVLKENGINASGYMGCIWCEESCTDYAYYFYLATGSSDQYHKNGSNDYDRIALTFN